MIEIWLPTERRWVYWNTHFSAPWDLIGLGPYIMIDGLKSEFPFMFHENFLTCISGFSGPLSSHGQVN